MKNLSRLVMKTENALHIDGLHKSAKKFYYLCKYGLVRLNLLKFNIGFLVVSVGQACNYKCRDCGNFAPYTPKQFMRYKLEDIKQWLTLIFNSADNIDTLQIQGGEPFLYSELGDLVSFIRNTTHWGGGHKVKNIVAATNGSILPDDDLLKKFKSCNVHVRISDYNITPDKTQQLVKVLEEHEISYSLYPFASGSGYWFNTGGVDMMNYHELDDKTVTRRYAKCNFGGCLTLERGQLARCSRGNNAPLIQGFKSKPGDYFVLSGYPDTKALRTELMKYYYILNFMEACRYCNGTNPFDMVEAAVQIN